MPTYDYQCRTCGERFELFQSFSEDTLTKCPSKKAGTGPAGCTSPGRGKVEKVFSAPGITFKGSGFYKNDSRGSSSSGGSSGAGDTTTKDTSSSKDTTSSTDTSSKDTSSKDTAKASSSKPSSTTKTPAAT